jgi:hypothetical protein
LRAGLGGHSFCRNPAGREAKSWCYTADPAARWEYCALPAPFSSCMPNELPLAVRAAQAKPPCLIEGPNPSGPLALFRKACGRTGANSTFGEICSRACCNAAADAARSCRADAKHVRRRAPGRRRCARVAVAARARAAAAYAAAARALSRIACALARRPHPSHTTRATLTRTRPPRCRLSHPVAAAAASPPLLCARSATPTRAT